VLDQDYGTDDPADALNATNTQCSFMNETMLICNWTWTPDQCGFYGVEMDSISDPETWLVGNIAESFEIVDEQTVHFNIRKGVKWNAGLPAARKLVGDRELTAKDVEWYFDYIMSAPKQKGRWEAVEYVKAIDNYTIEAKSKVPDIFLVSELAASAYTYVFCPDVGKKYGNFQDWKVNVGTGPFIRTDLVPGSSATYEKNPDYWGTDERNPSNQIPYVDKVREVFLTDVATELAAFRTGKIDQCQASGMDRHQFADLIKTNPETGYAKSITGNSYWSLRGDIKPFSDLRVRKALNMAVNRKEITDNFYGGEASMWNDPYPPIYKDIYMPFDTLPEDIKEIYSYNPEGAKKLLAEAGYPDGFKTSLVYYAAAGSELHEKNALIASYLAKVGVDVELKLVDSATNRSMRYGFTYPQMYGDGMGVNEPEHFYSVWIKSDAPWNRNRVNDPYVDETIAKALTIFDAKERRALYRELDYYYLRHCYMGIAPVNGYSYTVWQPWMKNYDGQRCLVFLGTGTIYARVWLDQDMREEMTGKR
jgi:peptide/nickel transport system substrate-binding protein